VNLPLARRALAEFLGTGLLVTVVVGSGIMAQRLSPADTGLQLLENSTATALGLAVLILILGPVSGAHFNPVVTLADHVLGRRAGTGVDPVFRSTTMARPSESRSSRSTRPVISTAPTCARSFCSTATSSLGLAACQARNLRTMTLARSRSFSLYQGLPKSR